MAPEWGSEAITSQLAHKSPDQSKSDYSTCKNIKNKIHHYDFAVVCQSFVIDHALQNSSLSSVDIGFSDRV